MRMGNRLNLREDLRLLKYHSDYLFKNICYYFEHWITGVLILVNG